MFRKMLHIILCASFVMWGAPAHAREDASALAPPSSFDKGNKPRTKEEIDMVLMNFFWKQCKEDMLDVRGFNERWKILLAYLEMEGVQGNFIAYNDTAFYLSFRKEGKDYYYKYCGSAQDQFAHKTFAGFKEMMQSIIREEKPIDLSPVLAHVAIDRKIQLQDTFEKIDSFLYFIKPLFDVTPYAIRFDEIRRNPQEKLDLIDGLLADLQKALTESRLTPTVRNVYLAKLKNTVNFYEQLGDEERILIEFPIEQNDVIVPYIAQLEEIAKRDTDAALLARFLLQHIKDYEINVLVEVTKPAMPVHLRQGAVKRLAESFPKHPKTVKTLLGLLDVHEPELEYTVLRALGKLSGPDVLNKLIEHLYNPDRRLMIAAALSLNDITDLGPQPDITKNFYLGNRTTVYFSLNIKGKDFYFKYWPDDAIKVPVEFDTLQSLLADIVQQSPYIDIGPIVRLDATIRAQKIRAMAEEVIEIVKTTIPGPFKQDTYVPLFEEVQSVPKDAEKKMGTNLLTLHQAVNMFSDNYPKIFKASTAAIIAERLQEMEKELQPDHPLIQRRQAYVDVIVKNPAAREPYMAQLAVLAATPTDTGQYAELILQDIKDFEIDGLVRTVRAFNVGPAEKLKALEEMFEKHPAHQKTFQTLVFALDLQNEDVKDRAVVFLGKLKNKAAIKHLKKFLLSPSTQLRRDAAEALTEVGDENVFADLVDMIVQEDSKLQRILEAGLPRFVSAEKEINRDLLLSWEIRVRALCDKLKNISSAKERFLKEDILSKIKTKIAQGEISWRKEPEKIVEMRTYKDRYNYYEFISSYGFKYRVTYPAGCALIRSLSTRGEWDVIKDDFRLNMIKEVLEKGFTNELQSVVGWYSERGEVKVFADRHDFKEAIMKEYGVNKIVQFLFDKTVRDELKRTEKDRRFTSVDTMLDFLTKDTTEFKDGSALASEVFPRIGTAMKDVMVGYVDSSQTFLPRIFNSYAHLFRVARGVSDKVSLAVAGAVVLKEAADTNNDRWPNAEEYRKMGQRFQKEFPGIDEQLKDFGVYWLKGFQMETEADAEDEFFGLLDRLGFVEVERRAEVRRNFVVADPVYSVDPVRAYHRGMMRLLAQIVAAKQVVRAHIARQAAVHEFTHFVHLAMMDNVDERLELRKHLRQKIRRSKEIEQVLQDRGYGDVFVGKNYERQGLITGELEIFANMNQWLAYPKMSAADDPDRIFEPDFDDIKKLQEIGYVPEWVRKDITLDDLALMDVADVSSGAIRLMLVDVGLRRAPKETPVYTVPKYASESSIRKLIYQDLPHDRDKELYTRYDIDPNKIGYMEITDTGDRLPMVGPEENRYLVMKAVTLPMQPDILMNVRSREVARSLYTHYYRNAREVMYAVYVIRKGIGKTEDDIYAVIMKEESDYNVFVDAMLADYMKNQESAYHHVKMIAEIINMFYGLVIQNLKDRMKPTEIDKMVDEEFLKRYKYDQIIRDYTLGFHKSPTDVKQQAAYLICIYSLYRHYRPIVDERKSNYAETFNRITQQIDQVLREKTITPIMNLMEWEEDRFQQMARRQSAKDKRRADSVSRDWVREQLLASIRDDMPPAEKQDTEWRGAALIETMQ